MAGRDLALTSATFDTTAAKFGSGALSGGYGTIANPLTSPNAFTASAWLKLAANPASLSLAFGQQDMFWLGVNPNGTITATIGAGTQIAATSTTVFPVGAAWSFFEVIVSGTPAATTITVYMNGASIATASGATNASLTNHPLAVGNFGGATTYQWTGEVDEFALFPTALTPSVPTAAYSGSEGMVLLYHLDGNGLDSSAGPLAVGTVTATASQTAVVLSLSAGLSGGSGTGYGLSVYRGTDPDFSVGPSSLLAANVTFPFTDSSPPASGMVFYSVVGQDSAGGAAYATPPGLLWAPAAPTRVGCQVQSQGIALVCIGDSITNGAGLANAGTVLSPTMPYFLIAKLQRLLGLRTVAGSNVGVGGKTLTDWAPGGSYYPTATSAMTSLLSANAGFQPVFSIMLGTNDSASANTNNSPPGITSPANFQSKLSAIVAQLLVDFPTAQVVVHMSPYFTPNTEGSQSQNGGVFLEAGLSALYSYRATFPQIVAGRPRVHLGDGLSFAYFAANYLNELQPDATGPNGTFYLHPNPTGAQSLGEMHAQAIANALFAPPAGIPNRWAH